MIGERYTLEREIGRGGMGSVWLGRDEVLGRPVALKRIGVAPGDSSPDVLRAEREARIAASLNHPHIVGVFDLVDDGDHQYLVMEYVEGRTLADLVRDGGALAPQAAARLLAQVASALATAHANHVVHRDVKPSNILVREDGQVKLSDFGIARSEADPSLTQTGLVTGSPAYLSPEVASGKTATPASDVWSLGATLFHALAGRPPYDVGDNVLGALYQIVNEPPPRLPDAGELAPVLMATMAHDPRRRWSMEDVARVLDLVAESATGAGEGAPTALLPDAPATDDEPVGTRHLPTATPSPASPVPPAPAPPPATPAARRGEAEPARRPRRRFPVLPVLVGLLVVVLVGVIAALALMDDPQDPAARPGGASEPTSQAPSTSEPPSEPSTPAPPTEAQMVQFVESYISTASTDPAAGFELLTSSFQDASNGLAGYEGFWGEVSNARVDEVSADPDSLTVTYTYTYNRRGQGRQTDTVNLQLVQDGDTLLIDGEA